MKIAFFGSGQFAVPILEAILKLRHDVPLVVTQPDRKKGRHLLKTPTSVKTFAAARNLKILQPLNPNDADTLHELQTLDPDIFVVVSYGKILSKQLLSAARKMCLNIHASLLPKYRGAGPIQWALINGERRTGVTWIRMNEHMDRGDVLAQKSLVIRPADHAASLEERLSQLAGRLVDPVLTSLSRGKARLSKQDERLATYAPLLKKQDGLIRWQESANKITNRFRGCFSWPGSFTYYKGKLLKVHRLRAVRSIASAPPGQITSVGHQSIGVTTGKGNILIEEVQPESHRRMDAASFLAGHKLRIGDRLGP